MRPELEDDASVVQPRGADDQLTIGAPDPMNDSFPTGCGNHRAQGELILSDGRRIALEGEWITSRSTSIVVFGEALSETLGVSFSYDAQRLTPASYDLANEAKGGGRLTVLVQDRGTAFVLGLGSVTFESVATKPGDLIKGSWTEVKRPGSSGAEIDLGSGKFEGVLQ